MRKVLFGSIIVVSILSCLLFSVKRPDQRVISYNLNVNPIDNMPLVDDDPFAAVAHGGAPVEQRSAEFRSWLAAGIKIRVSNASGSGTIVYFDSKDGWAYVQTCGHLWEGNMTAEEGKRRNITCKVITWYKNDIKLDKPAEYPAEVIYFSNTRGRDVALIRFKPDWAPEFFPIAPGDYEYKDDMRLHSVGCDGGREVAHYNVRYVGMRDVGGGWNDLVTTENSPRPGRSGGGLMDDDMYVGICWGTSSYDGSGNGYFTPLATIRQYNKQNGYGWLNEVGVNLARMIPILDRNNPQGEYPPNYIPMPERR